MNNKSLFRNLCELIGSVLAAIIVVKGIIATMPDFFLIDRHGEIHGIIQLALGVIGLITFSATYKFLDKIDSDI